MLLGLGDGVPAGQEHQLVHVIRGLVDGELGYPAGLAQALDADAGEVGDEHVLGPLVLADGAASEVVQCLLVGGVEVSAEGLGLAQGDAGPEEVDVAGPAGGGAGGAAFEQVDLSPSERTANHLRRAPPRASSPLLPAHHGEPHPPGQPSAARAAAPTRTRHPQNAPETPTPNAPPGPLAPRERPR